MKTPRNRAATLNPITYGLRLRDRFLWPIQIAQLALTLGATYAMFVVGGGDWRQPLAAGLPLTAAGVTFLTLGLVAILVEFEARATERRSTGRPHADCPDTLPTAERAIICAALQIDRAQLPAEHPQYHDLRAAVDLLHRAIESGETVHPDVARIYRRIAGTNRAGRVRHAVEQVVRTHGPIGLPDIVDRLAIGGPWGAPISATGQLVRLMLRDPHDRNTPVAWLAPRQPEEPFQHRANLNANV